MNLPVSPSQHEVVPENYDSGGTISTCKLKRNKNDRNLLCQEGELWHRRMGHISSSYVQKLKNVATGLNDLICTNNINNCTTCAKSKLTRKIFNKQRSRATRPCEIIHADLIGPITPKTYHTQNSYILCVIDDFTRFLFVFVLKTKNETIVCMKEALKTLQAQFPSPGQFNTLRCDGGTEFVNGEMESLLGTYGISCEPAEPYTHEHNGTVERLNRTLEN